MSDTDIVSDRDLKALIDHWDLAPSVKECLRELQRLRAGRAAVWAECRETCAKALEEESGKATIPANKVTLLAAAHICRALEVPNE